MKLVISLDLEELGPRLMKQVAEVEAVAEVAEAVAEVAEVEAVALVQP